MCSHHVMADSDSAAELARVGTRALEDGGNTCAPRSRREKSRSGARAKSTDYFVFHQDESGWGWQRVNQFDAVVKVSNAIFHSYTDCIADARDNGWQGQAWFQLASNVAAA